LLLVTQKLNKVIQKRFHYAWIALAITFIVMLLTAATRATPGILILPLEQVFGWDRATISLALSVNLVLFGLMGSFAAAAMQHYGIRKTVLSVLVGLSILVALSSLIKTEWQLIAIWGVGIGMLSGVTFMTLGATVVNRWFDEKRGLAMGLLTASSATGQLIFLPGLAYVVENYGWQSVVIIVSVAIATVIPLVFFFFPEKPTDLNLTKYGAVSTSTQEQPVPKVNPIQIAFGTLKEAIHHKAFWLLFFSFFICGATTNGYIGTHFIAMCGDNGISPVRGAGVLAMMGFFDLIGTTLSGWLSDRYNNKVLLFWYYGLRGIALLFLPAAFGYLYFGLPIFAFIYGLDWIATVPPTVRLCTDIFGAQKAPIVFGWIVAGHQIGAAFAALMAGVIHNTFGNYNLATVLAGVLCMVAAIIVLRIRIVSLTAQPSH